MAGSSTNGAARPGGRGLRAPGPADARAALERVCDDPAATWELLLAVAGLSGAETGRAALERLLAAMDGDVDPLVALCARTLRVRLEAADHLAGEAPAGGAGDPAAPAGSTADDLADDLADARRLAVPALYDVDHPELRARLDELSARTAAQLQRPIGLVTLVLDSAQVLAGAHGVSGWVAEAGGTPVEWAFCAQTVRTDRPYVVADAATDALQARNPMVVREGLASYAGVPLRTPEGAVIGAHCVLDLTPRDCTPEQVAVLEHGALEAVAIFEDYRRLR